MNPIELKTPLVNLHQFEIAGLSNAMSRKLAMAVAGHANKSDLSEATVEDLLNYFPMRYEDRSNFLQIDELTVEMEASVELFARVSGGFKVGKNRGPKAPPLYIFEITGGDAERTRKPVVVWWFVSGKQAHRIISYYQSRFTRGTRFVAYGRWEWDSRRNTFSLRLNKPDELEILPSETDYNEFGLLKNLTEENETKDKGQRTKDNSDEDLLEDEDNPEFAMIHSGRRVPVYRKLGQFQTKRLREIIYNVLENLDKKSIVETLPEDLRERQKLISRAEAVEQIHFPPENSSIFGIRIGTQRSA